MDASLKDELQKYLHALVVGPDLSICGHDILRGGAWRTYTSSRASSKRPKGVTRTNVTSALCSNGKSWLTVKTRNGDQS